MRHPYPSDISHEQFEQLRSLPENARKKTSPRKVDLYEVFCAVLSLLRTGCQWRTLPSDFPKGRNACSTLLIVDAQGVEKTDTAELKGGYDAVKKVSGLRSQASSAMARWKPKVFPCSDVSQEGSAGVPPLQTGSSLLADSGLRGSP